MDDMKCGFDVLVLDDEHVVGEILKPARECVRECATRLNYAHPEINVCHVVIHLGQNEHELCHARTWLILRIAQGAFAAGGNAQHEDPLVAICNAFAVMTESLETFQRTT